jgi:predicted esterase
MHSLTLSPDLHLSFVGPSLEKGPLPALFYFALSKEDSLGTDPYNQPVAFLKNYPMRIFSLDLPYHGKDLSPLTALKGWADEIGNGVDIIDEFTDKVLFAVKELLKKEVLLEDKIAVAGLSRGAFIACHAAAKIKELNFILGFAPLTRLSFLKDFEEIQEAPLVKSLHLEVLTEALVGKPLRFYIGNRDKRVGTSLSFHFIEALAEVSFHHHIRSSQVELYITPSIGHHGHGTSKEVFEKGAFWIAEKLGVA